MKIRSNSEWAIQLRARRAQQPRELEQPEEPDDADDAQLVPAPEADSCGDDVHRNLCFFFLRIRTGFVLTLTFS